MEPVVLAVDWGDVAQAVTDYINDKLVAAGQAHLVVEEGSLKIDWEQGWDAPPNVRLVELVTEPEPPAPLVQTLAEYLAGQAPQAETPRLREKAQVDRDRQAPRLPRLPRAPRPPRPPSVADVPAAPLDELLASQARQVLAAEAGPYAHLAEDPEPPPLVLPQAEAEPAPLVTQGPGGVTLYGAPPEVTPEAKAAFAALQKAGIVDAHLTPELLASQSREDVLDGVGEVLKGGYVKGSTPPAGHPDDPYKNKPWRRSVQTFVQGALRQTEG